MYFIHNFFVFFGNLLNSSFPVYPPTRKGEELLCWTSLPPVLWIRPPRD